MTAIAILQFSAQFCCGWVKSPICFRITLLNKSVMYFIFFFKQINKNSNHTLTGLNHTYNRYLIKHFKYFFTNKQQNLLKGNLLNIFIMHKRHFHFLSVVVLCCVGLICTVQCCAVLYCDMLCCVLLCFALLCCVVKCFALLCCVVLCFAVFC